MYIALSVLAVGALVFVAHLLSALFEKTRIPDLLVFMVIGMALGPVAGWMHPSDLGRVGPIFAVLTLIIILFESGQDLRLHDMRKTLWPALALTLAGFALSALAVTAALQAALGLPLDTALTAGAMLGAPAPSVVLRLVRFFPLRPETRSLLVMETALGDVLIITATLVMWHVSQDKGSLTAILGRTAMTFAAAMLIGAACGVVWALLLEKVRELEHSQFTTAAFVFVLYGMLEVFHVNGLVAVLAFGVTIGNVDVLHRLSRRYDLKPLKLNRRELDLLGELVFLFSAFFFVYMGLTMNPLDYRSLGVGCLLTLALLGARLASSYFTLPASLPRGHAAMLSLMMPRGLASAVLAALALEQGVPRAARLFHIVNATILASIVLTALLTLLLEKGRVLTPVFNAYFFAHPESAAPDPPPPGPEGASASGVPAIE